MAVLFACRKSSMTIGRQPLIWRRFHGEKGVKMLKESVIVLTFASFSAAAGQLLFKVGATGKQHLLEFLNVPIVLGLICYALSTVLWIYGLSIEKLVSVYAFTALSFALVYLGGAVILGERISAWAALGVGLVMAGLALIVSKSS
jgi:drug/metabolite transporter (DMT)-like permease